MGTVNIRWDQRAHGREVGHVDYEVEVTPFVESIIEMGRVTVVPDEPVALLGVVAPESFESLVEAEVAAASDSEVKIRSKAKNGE